MIKTKMHEIDIKILQVILQIGMLLCVDYKEERQLDLGLRSDSDN